MRALETGLLGPALSLGNLAQGLAGCTYWQAFTELTTRGCWSWLESWELAMPMKWKWDTPGGQLDNIWGSLFPASQSLHSRTCVSQEPVHL